MKPLCIIGVINTPNGLKIKDELIASFRKHYRIITVTHNGEYFEYPAINVAVKKCIELNEPVLYIHTKGAFNTIPHPTCHYENNHIRRPKEATLEDWQPTVRKMWAKEFCDNMDKYIKPLDTNRPIVTTPFSGGEKETWYNGFMMNPAAAKTINPIPLTGDRYVYQKLFKGTNTEVRGILGSDISTHQQRDVVKNIVWTYF